MGKYIKNSTQFIIESIRKSEIVYDDMSKCEVSINPETGEKVDMTKLRGEIEYIRGAIGKINPCFGELCSHLTFIYTWDVKTQATDGTRLFMNPSWTEKLTPGEKRFVMVHELLHCVFGHLARGMKHDRMLSNIAADYECNGTAFIEGYVNSAQLDHMGAYYSDTFGSNMNNMWGYESIYHFLKENPDKVPVNPKIDLIMNVDNEGNAKKPKYVSVHTSREWKHGHKDAKSAIRNICMDEYENRGVKNGDDMTKEELIDVVESVISKVPDLFGKYPRTGQPIGELDGDVEEGFQTYEDGWDYAIDESLTQFAQYLAMLKSNGGGTPPPPGIDPPEQKIPATDPTETEFPFPKFKQPGGGNGGGNGTDGEPGNGGGNGTDGEPGNGGEEEGSAAELNKGKGGTGNKNKQLSNNDIISQQEGAEIAKRAGYTGDDVTENTIPQVENEWKEHVSKVAGKDGSYLITRQLDVKAQAQYDWKRMLRQYMNAAMQNTRIDRNIWGHKKGLARGEMVLKHKTENNAMKDLVFLIDCSGSISDKMLSNILSECYGIASNIHLKDITYAYFTTRVELVETTNQRYKGTCSDNAVILLQNTKKHPSGGHISGGTDFKNALDWVDENGGARCVIMFTDGYDEPVPAPASVKNLIWCVYDYPEFETVDDSDVVYLKSEDFAD